MAAVLASMAIKGMIDGNRTGTQDMCNKKRFSLADDRRFGARLDFHKTVRFAEPNAISASKMSISIDGNRTGTQDLCKKTIFTALAMFVCPHHLSSKTICFAVSNAMSGL